MQYIFKFATDIAKRYVRSLIIEDDSSMSIDLLSINVTCQQLASDLMQQPPLLIALLSIAALR